MTESIETLFSIRIISIFGLALLIHQDLPWIAKGWDALYRKDSLQSAQIIPGESGLILDTFPTQNAPSSPLTPFTNQQFFPFWTSASHTRYITISYPHTYFWQLRWRDVTHYFSFGVIITPMIWYLEIFWNWLAVDSRSHLQTHSKSNSLWMALLPHGWWRVLLMTIPCATQISQRWSIPVPHGWAKGCFPWPFPVPYHWHPLSPTLNIFNE
jgi:hypothetical protein